MVGIDTSIDLFSKQRFTCIVTFAAGRYGIVPYEKYGTISPDKLK